jgi:hypothetical protein
MGHGRKSALDFEHAHAPFAGAQQLRLGVSIEFLSLEDGMCLRRALADLVPVDWNWSEPDADGCFSGWAQAYMTVGQEREVERALEARIEPFAPGYGLAWAYLNYPEARS